MAARTTWAEKLANSKPPQVKRLDKAFADMPEGCMMLIASPAIIDEYIWQVPKGKSVDLNTLRNDLAMQYHAEKTCPLTTGIFLRIVAEAAYDKHLQGAPLSRITPFWRVISEKMPLAKKLSFGAAVIQQMRKKEHLP